MVSKALCGQKALGPGSSRTEKGQFSLWTHGMQQVNLQRELGVLPSFRLPWWSPGDPLRTTLAGVWSYKALGRGSQRRHREHISRRNLSCNPQGAVRTPKWFDLSCGAFKEPKAVPVGL